MKIKWKRVKPGWYMFSTISIHRLDRSWWYYWSSQPRTGPFLTLADAKKEAEKHA